MSFTLCSSNAILYKAGASVDTTASTSAAILEEFSEQAEGYINTATRFDWVASYAGISANFKKILDDCCSNLAATYLITYDMGTYTGRGEAEDMLNVLMDRVNKQLKILEDDKAKTAMGVT